MDHTIEVSETVCMFEGGEHWPISMYAGESSFPSPHTVSAVHLESSQKSGQLIFGRDLSPQRGWI